jgi:hypothetical protein
MDFSQRYSRTSATEITLCAEIETLASTLSTEFPALLRDHGVTFGTAQKMVSLYLKYRWLLGAPDKKPLFAVVDRQIMEKANIRPLLSFPKLSKDNYLEVVHKIDAFAKTRRWSGLACIDGASWEAEAWTDTEDQSAEEP